MSLTRVCDRCGAVALANANVASTPVSIAKSVNVPQAAPATNQAAVTKDFGTTLTVTLSANDFCVPCALSALKAYLTAVGG